MSSDGKKCFVFGGGVLGIESAIAGTAAFDEVILFVVPNSSAGSSGESRIVRPDYPTEGYMRYAIKSWKIWLEDPAYSVFVSPNRGRYITYLEKYSAILKAIDISRKLFEKPPCVRVSSEQIKAVFGSRENFDALFGDNPEYVFSPDDYALYWNGYMESRFEVARRSSVKIKEEKVLELDIIDGHITGIRTQTKDFEWKHYDVASSDICTLATGAWSQELCRKWHIDLPEFHQPVPVAIISFEVQLTASQLADVVPIIDSIIGIFEYVPPTKQSKIVKFTWLEHKCVVGNNILSDPQIFEDSAIMHAAKHRLKAYLYHILPNFDNIELKGRVQFCSMSNAGMPVIDRHRTISNLAVAINDNFTVAKLAPIIGEAWTNAVVNSQPEFPLYSTVKDTHAQPALETETTFEKMVERAEGYLRHFQLDSRM